MNKLKHDYPTAIIVKVHSHHWKEEYQHIYRERLRAVNFIKVLRLIKKEAGEYGEYDYTYRDFNELYIALPDREIYANELTMLPANIIPVLEESIFTMTIQWGKYFIYLLNEKYEITEHEIITFLTLLFYKYPDIMIWNEYEDHYLYNPLAPEPIEPTKEWQCVYEYWKRVLKI